MGRSALITALAAAALATGCPASNNNPGAGRPDGGPSCQSGDNSCAAGTRCVNRNCVPTCSGGAACQTGSYCEGPNAPEDVCAQLTPIACTTPTQCPFPQTCLNGLCASAELRADGGYQGCVVNGGVNDACGPDAVCYALTQGNTCLGLPACGQDGGCPTGVFGAVCNDGRLDGGAQVLPGKQRLCLYAYCVLDSDCPAAAECFHSTLAIPSGTCYFGAAGSPCFSNKDCFQSAACAGQDGGLEDGGIPGACR